MSKPMKELPHSKTNNGTRSLGYLNGQESRDINNADSSQTIPVMSEKVARQLRALTDLLSEQLDLLCDVMKDLRQDPISRSEENNGLIQGSSPAAPNHMFDSACCGSSKQLPSKLSMER